MNQRHRPKGWVETITPEGGEPTKFVLEAREGNRVFLRQLDPGESFPGRVPVYEGEEVVVMTAISHVGFHSTGEVGSVADLITSMRVVPVRRENGVVYARTLGHGEPDTGQRVHVRPGEDLKFEQGAIVAQLAYMDSLEEATASGYVPLSPVLWKWFAFGGQARNPTAVRYLLAAARRLDTANDLFSRMRALAADLSESGEAMTGPAIRHRLFLLIGAVEMAVIALGRAMAMTADAPRILNVDIPTPGPVADVIPSLTEIRNAYEHIEDRALGKVRGKPEEQALTIFDYDSLVREDAIVYGDHRLDLKEQVPSMVDAARSFLKDVAGEI